MAELHDFAGLAASLERTLAAAVPAVGVVELSVPPRPEHGDVSTNAALVFGGRAKRATRELADELGRAWIQGDGAGLCDRY